MFQTTNQSRCWKNGWKWFVWKRGLRETIIRLVRCSLRCRLLWIPVWPVVLKLKIHEHFSQSIFTVLPWDGVFISTFQLVSDLAGSSDPSYRKAGPNGRGAFNFSFEMVQGRIVAAPFASYLPTFLACHTMEPWNLDLQQGGTFSVSSLGGLKKMDLSQVHWNWPFIVDFPSKMVIFHSYVSLPEGNQHV